MTKVACPCCGFLTLDERAAFEICPVCFWEDEYADGFEIGPVKFPSGPDDPSPANHGLTLNEARANYREFGAVAARFVSHVRKPTTEEYP